MVRALSRAGVTLVRVADDAERRFVDRDLNPLDRTRIGGELRVTGKEAQEPPDRAGRLMLVESELEVHTHHGEIVAAGGQLQIERAYALVYRPLEQAKDRLGIAEDIGRADKAAHRSPHR